MGHATSIPRGRSSPGTPPEQTAEPLTRFSRGDRPCSSHNVINPMAGCGATKEQQTLGLYPFLLVLAQVATLGYWPPDGGIVRRPTLRNRDRRDGTLTLKGPKHDDCEVPLLPGA